MVGALVSVYSVITHYLISSFNVAFWDSITLFIRLKRVEEVSKNSLIKVLLEGDVDSRNVKLRPPRVLVNPIKRFRPLFSA
nr:hypothetical protein HmN_000881600 [Hymenolepis microstoma]